MILSFLFYAFVFYLAYRLLFDFIIPVFRTTRRVRKGFRDMHNRMNEHTSQYQQETKTTPQSTKKTEPSDYIDFEEIK